MDLHQIAYFLALALLLSFPIYFLVTGRQIGGLTDRSIAAIVLIATFLIMYDYSYTHGYIQI